MIDILLGTYKGEKFLASQILSLLSQTWQNWRLLIHDDGSTDNTVAVIKRFQATDGRIVFIDDGICNLGAALNFMHLLQYADAPAIIFCDQDDIWFENKLELLATELNKIEAKTPAAVFCNAYAYSSSRGIVADKVTWTYPTDLRSFLFMNAGIQGCSILFNKSLKETMFPVPKSVAMHDHLVTMCAVTFGRFEYLDKNLMLYRQHVANVTGGASLSIGQRIRSFVRRLGSNGVLEKKHYAAVKDFYEERKSYLDPATKKLYDAYLAFPHAGPMRRLSIVLSNGFKIFNSRLLLLVKTVILKPIR